MTRNDVALPATGRYALVGTRAAVRAALANDPRRPVWRSQPHLVGGRWVVNVRLVSRRERHRPRTLRPVWIAAGAVAVLAALGSAAISLASWVAAHWAALAGLAALVVLAWLVGAAKTGCPGMHCAGCKHR